MPRHPSTVTLENFRGLDNKNPDNRTDPSFLTTADNIDIDATGSIRKRLGYTSVITGTSMHSLWGDGDDMFFFSDGDLLKYTSGGGTILVGSGYPVARTDFHKIGDRIFFTSTAFNGVIETDTVRDWGINTPVTQPTLTSSIGNMQAAITYISSDGRESGAQIAVESYSAAIDTSPVYLQGALQATGITLTGIPISTDPTVSTVRIYLTQQHGEVFMLAGEISNGVTTFSHDGITLLSVPLATQFIDPAPYGDLVESYNGRLYVANENFLWYSEPGAYEWFQAGKNFISFGGKITNIMPVDDGIFVTADKLYFLDGKAPDSFRLREREIYKAVKYTAVKIIGGDIIMENIPTGMKWLFNSDKGFIMVGTGGMVFNLTEKNVMIDKSDEGAAFFKSDDGMNQYISVLKDPENNRMHVGDRVDTTVIRNGIVIT